MASKWNMGGHHNTDDDSMQQDYCEYCDLCKRVRLADPSEPAEAIQPCLVQAQAVLHRMKRKAEAIGVDDSDKREEWLERIELYRNQLLTLEVEQGRAALTARSNNEKPTSTQEMLEHQSALLEQARRTLLETEELAGDITDNLQGQRQTMESSQRKVSLLQSLTDRAHGLTDSLNKPWWKKI